MIDHDHCSPVMYHKYIFLRNTIHCITILNILSKLVLEYCLVKDLKARLIMDTLLRFFVFWKYLCSLLTIVEAKEGLREHIM